MVNLVVKITEQLTVRSFVVECSLRLRKTNRIKLFKASGSVLSTEGMTAILEKKHVIAPLREVQEIRNALAAYDEFEKGSSSFKTHFKQ